MNIRSLFIQRTNGLTVGEATQNLLGSMGDVVVAAAAAAGPLKSIYEEQPTFEI